MADEKEKKSIFDKLVDAVSDRDEKAAAAKAAADKLAAEKAAAQKAALDKAAADKAAAEIAAADKLAAAKAAADKAAADKLAAEKVAAQKVAEEKASAERMAAMKAAAEKVQAERERAMKEAAEKAAAPKKGVVQVRSLFIRKDHDAKAQSVGGLVAGNEVTIYETWTDGKDTWARIGEGQWSAMIYNGETYIKIG